MACLITRDSSGKITDVKTPNGQRSRLFEEIHTNPFMADMETSVNIFKNAYSEEVQQLFDGVEENVYDTKEPKLFYRSSDNEVYEDLESLIINNPSGRVTIGFSNPKNQEFIPVAQFSTQGSKKAEFIYNSIADGTLHPKRKVMPDGTTRFQGKGEYPETRLLMARAVKMNAAINQGYGNVKVFTDGTITMPFDEDFTVRIIKDGHKVIRIEDIEKEVSPEDENYADLIATHIERKYQKLTDKDKPESTFDKNQVLDKFNAFLRDLGFSTTTLQKYKESYKTRYGQDPDIQALADMSNKVVALSQGAVNIEGLSEEVAHIAIEYYSDQNSIASAIASAHLTPEYKEYSEYYRDKYSSVKNEDNAPKYEGAALEEQVRKEVLGKVLKQEFLNRFQTPNQTLERRSVADKVRQFFNNFLEYISQIVGSSQIRTIEKLNEEIADAVLTNRIDDFNLDTYSENIFYSAQSKDSRIVEGELKQARAVLENLFSNILKENNLSQASLDLIADEMTELKTLSSLNTMSGIAEQQVSILKAALKDSQRSKEPLSQKNTSRYIHLTENLMPKLQSIKTNLKTIEPVSEENKDRLKTIERSIDNVQKELGEINPQIEKFFSENARRLVEEVVNSNPSLTQEQRDEILSKFETAGKDVGMLQWMFGLASQSRNPVIALIAKKAMDMRQKVNIKHIPVANKVIQTVSGKDYKKYEKDIIKKDKDNKKTYYYDSMIDWNKYDQELDLQKKKIISEVLEKPLSEIEENWTGREKDFLTNDTDYNNYKDALRSWQQDNHESPTTEAYQKEKLKRYEDANISDYTKETISNKNRERFKRDRKYRNADGSIDNSRKSEQDKQQDKNDFYAHKAAKNPYYKGDLREGLKVAKFSELTQEDINKIPSSIIGVVSDPEFFGDVIIPDENNSIEDLIEDSRQVVDLFNLDMLYRKEMKDKSKSGSPTEKFLETIRSIEEDTGSAYEWMISNSTVTLNDEFYQDLGTGFRGYIEVAEEFVEDIEDDIIRREKRALLEELKDLQRAKKSLLKQARKPSNPMETDAYGLGATRENIVKLEEEIDNIKYELNVDSDYFEGLEFDNQTSTRAVNEDFELMYNQSDANSVYDFAVQHMTTKNKRKVYSFSASVGNYLRGKTTEIKPEFEQFIEEVNDSGLIRRLEEDRGRNLSIRELEDTYKEEFAKKNVASYFQRFEPKGYQRILEDMKSGELSIYEYLTNRESIEERYEGAEYLEIRPDYTWTEDINNEEFKNAKYVNEEYYLQPKLDKYLDDSFFEKYGISKSEFLKNPTYNLNELTATKNNDQFEILKLVVGLREQSLEQYGDTQGVNKFLIPQISRTGFEKISGILKFKGKENWNDIVKDIFQDRIDVKEHGELVDEDNFASSGPMDNVRIIPKYFQHKLESPEEVTDNIIQAAIIDYKESLMYKERTNAENDFRALMFQARNQKYISEGLGINKGKITKKGQVSNYNKWAENYIDYVLYGIKQSRRFNVKMLGKDVDVTRVVNSIQGWTRFSNLAYNFFVDATSATTGLTVNLLDRLSGEYYHTSSANRAMKLSDEVFKYIAEEGKLDKTSELNHLLEYFGVEQLDDRVKNSSFGRGMRLIDDSPYLMSKISNMAIKPRAMLAVLCDVRYIDGKFLSFDQYYSLRRNQVMKQNESRSKEDKIPFSRKAVTAEFKKAAKESLYDHLDITKEGINFNNKFKEKFPDNTKEEFERISLNTSSRLNVMIQNIDTVISADDQLAAQRDVVTNTLMMHKGWLPINLTRAFKKEQYNFAVGKLEEGRYITLFKFLKKSLKNRGDIRKALQDIKENEDLNKIENLRRVTYEMGLLSAIVALGSVIFAGDDEDDSYLEDVAQYIYLRTSQEYTSANIFGIGKSVVETAKSPITAIKTVEYLEPITFVESVGGALVYPFYRTEEGGKAAWKFAKALTPAKRIEQYSDIQNQIGTYWYFNKKTIPFGKPD